MSKYELPDHPEIARAMRTGYPYPAPAESLECTDCGADLVGDDEVYDWDTDLVCEDCFLDRLLYLTPNEKAKRLGVDHYTVTEHFENMKGEIDND